MTYLESIVTGQYLNVSYPHCDPRVLHGPGECEYCDLHSDWQAERAENKVLFTDDPRNAVLINAFLASGRLVGEFIPCPGMLARGDAIKIWGGNQARLNG